MTVAVRRARHDERNLARLNLVLAQNRTALQRWRKELALDALGTMTVECISSAGSVVPHGIDNDVLLALVSAAVVQNVPPGGVIRISVRELLRLSGMGINGRTYQQVEEILYRLRESNYRVHEGWYDGRKHQVRSAAFSIVSEFYTATNTAAPNPNGRWQAETLLVVRLNTEVLSSIQAGFIRALDAHLIEELDQPMARNVYRALSMLRQTAEEDQGTPVLSLTLPLIGWGEHLGLTYQFNPRDLPRLIERALTPAHEHLKHAGYLADVRIEGRGRQKAVTYHFATGKSRPANAESAQLLARVLPERKALELSVHYSPDHIRATLAHLEALLANGYKARTKQGLFVDMLRDPERYRKGQADPRPAAGPPRPPQGASEDPVLPEADRPSRKKFETFFGMLKNEKAVLPYKERLWALYEAERVHGIHLLGLGTLDPDDVLKQVTAWENH